MPTEQGVNDLDFRCTQENGVRPEYAEYTRSTLFGQQPEGGVRGFHPEYARSTRSSLGERPEYAEFRRSTRSTDGRSTRSTAGLHPEHTQGGTQEYTSRPPLATESPHFKQNHG